MRESIRALRRDLGVALAQDGRKKEGLEQLIGALAEPGSSPAAWELQVELGDLHQALGDPGRALEAYILAVLANPEAKQAASRALRLLGPDAGLSWQGATGARLQSALATTRAPSASVCRLTARLLRLEGDLQGAVTALECVLAGGTKDRSQVLADLVDVLIELGDPEYTQRILDAHSEVDDGSLRAVVLFEQGRFEETLAAAPQTRAPRAAALRMLALVGLQRAQEALAVAPDRHDSLEVDAARVVAHLALQQYTEARHISERLSHTTTDNVDVILLHAQVLLEGAGNDGSAEGFNDVDEARRTFQRLRVVEQSRQGRLSARLLRRPWLRLQTLVRAEDDRFQYAVAEATFGLDSGVDDLRSVLHSCRLYGTTYLQDAAVKELLAQLAGNSETDSEAVAAAQEAAASAVLGCGHPRRARTLARAAVELAPTLSRRVLLANASWGASYDESVDRDTRLAQLAEAIIWLDAEGGDIAPDAGTDSAYLHGLMLTRLAELSPETVQQIPRTVRALPFLLASVLAERDAYYFIHTALALNQVSASASAYLCAESATELLPEEPQLRETYLITLVNHHADQARLTTALESVSGEDWEQAWLDSLRLHVALLNGLEDEVRVLLARPGFEATWARWDRLQAEVLVHGLESCREELEKLAADVRKDGTEEDTLADIYRLLGRLDDADQATAEAERAGIVQPVFLARVRTLTALARNPSRDAEEVMGGLIRAECAPSRIRTTLHVDLPLLRLAAPAVAPVIDRLTEMCRVRLEAILCDPPSVAADIEVLPGGLVDGELLRVLLDILEAEHAGRPSDALQLAADLEQMSASGALAVSLAAARRAVQRRAGQALAEALSAGMPVRDAEKALALVGSVRDSLDDLTVARAQVGGWASMGGDAPSERLVTGLAGDLDPEALAQALGELVVRRAVSGDDKAARAALDAGCVLPELTDRFSVRVAEAVTSAAEYRAVDDVLTTLEQAGWTVSAPGGGADAVRRALHMRLDHLMGLLADPSESHEPVIPIVVELGSALVPFVDPAQDGGTFLDRLIPELKDRLHELSGVRIPGLRLRPGDLMEHEFTVDVDEVLVARGTVAIDMSPDVGTGAAPADDDLGKEPDPAARDLIKALEASLRPHLPRFLGMQEVSDFADNWVAEAESTRLKAFLLEDESRIALTWALKAALEDGLSIADSQAVLAAVAAALDTDAPRLALRDAVGASLRRSHCHTFPGSFVEIPPEKESALVSSATLPRAGALVRHELARWLRENVAADRDITLVANSEAGRRLVTPVARAECQLAVIVTTDDLEGR